MREIRPSGSVRGYGVIRIPTATLNRSVLVTNTFRLKVGWLWHRTLSRRGQNGRVSWDRMRCLIDRWLPPVRVYHPFPLRRMGVIT